MVLKRIKYTAICLFLLLFGAAFIIYPERYAQCCLEGFVLWAKCVMPSLFPFMIISLIFIKTGMAEKAALPLKKITRALNMPENAAVCFILSICSGYPAGSRMLIEFYNNGAISKSDCDKLAPLCSTSGPLFIIGSVGYGMFGDKALGAKIFLAHAISVLLVGIIYCKLCKKSRNLPEKKLMRPQNLLYDVFYGAIVSVAVAGGFIAFFYVVALFLQDFNLFLPAEKFLGLFLDEKAAKAVCLGFVEVTTGCRFLSESATALKGAFAGFMITFGGVSILMQQLSYLTSAEVKPLRFICIKFIQAALCFVIMLIIQ